jgi:hypothetical protein
MTEEIRDDLINSLVIMNEGKSENYYLSLNDDELEKEYDRFMELRHG